MPISTARKSFCTFFAVSLLFTGNSLRAQQTSGTVAYEQTFKGSDPDHYLISVASDCSAKYQSNGKLTLQADSEETFVFEFTITPSTCAKLFELTRRAHYFDRAIDSKKKNLASTGVKVLSYSDADKNFSETYNYSPNSDIQQLTSIFQTLGATLEIGRRLDYDHHYQKLALDQELKRMEDTPGRNSWPEVAAIAPTLQKIVDDPSLMNVVRARAQRLLAAVRE